jgi:hypothetical protein
MASQTSSSLEHINGNGSPQHGVGSAVTRVDNRQGRVHFTEPQAVVAPETRESVVDCETGGAEAVGASWSNCAAQLGEPKRGVAASLYISKAAMQTPCCP